MTLSNFVILGIAEAFAAALCIAVIFIFLYRKASGRMKRLRTQLTQLKETTVFLLDKVNEPASYQDQLSAEIDQTVAYFNETSPGELMTWQNSLDPAAKVAVLRNYFLQGEKKSVGILSSADKWNQLSTSLQPVIDLLSSAGTGIAGDDKYESMKEKWPELCDAAIALWEEQSTDAEDNFVVLLQLINSELGFEHLAIPDQKPHPPEVNNEENRVAVGNLMVSSADQKELISNLLSQRDAAESEVSIRVEELRRLERFLKESEVCITLVEDELSGLRAEVTAFKKAAGKTAKMKIQIDDFEQECTKMISCIESLERENDELRARH